MTQEHTSSYLRVFIVVVFFPFFPYGNQFVFDSPRSGGTDYANGGIQDPIRTTPATEAGATHTLVSGAYGKLLLQFEANRGQTDPRVKFLARAPGHAVFLTPTEAVLVLTQPAPPKADDRRMQRRGRGEGEPATQRVLRMSFLGTSTEPLVAGGVELPGKANYFIGKDPAKWRTHVPTYAQVRYQDLYPGIDLLWYSNPRELEYDFIVAPGADPTTIGLGIQGADGLEIDRQGDLVLSVDHGALRLRKPFIYQEGAGGLQEVSGGYVLKDPHHVGFQFGAYDRSRPLVIDPGLSYSTYLGGTDGNRGIGIAVDASGNAYVTGNTISTDFPTTSGAFDTSYNTDRDAFVTKLSPDGSALLYSTFLGGGDQDLGAGIAVDAAGNAYVTGRTLGDFPTTVGAFQPNSNDDQDAFVTKLNSTGSALLYSTYLSGDHRDRGTGIAVDSSGNAYVSGETQSPDFPTTSGAFDTTQNGNRDWDAFVTKLNPAGSALLYSTYLGGTYDDRGTGIVVDPSGNAYVTGLTGSTDFPTTAGAFDTSCNADAFVTKLNPAGSALLYSTCLGGSYPDPNEEACPVARGTRIAVDAAGNAYVTGDASVAKLNPAGSALLYSTHLGGTGSGIAVDASGNAYVTGTTSSTDFPTTSGAFDTSYNGDYDAFVTKLNPAGSALLYWTYLGGTSCDEGLGIAVDASGNAYVTGHTSSLDFPSTPVAFDTTFNGSIDAFVTKLDISAAFMWPIEVPHVTQDYAWYRQLSRSGKRFHTGIDANSDETHGVWSFTAPVHAAGSGEIVGIWRVCNATECGSKGDPKNAVTWCNGSRQDLQSIPTENSGLGNAVIIRHGHDVFTLYGHLDCIEEDLVVDYLSGNREVDQGRLLGRIGNAYKSPEREGGLHARRYCSALHYPPHDPSGQRPYHSCLDALSDTNLGVPLCTRCEAHGFTPHLHFEGKSKGVLGDPATDGSSYWGYTPTPPDEHGYKDPMLLIHAEAQPVSPPIIVNATADLPLRPGPARYDEAPNELPSGSTVIAYRNATTDQRSWYQVHLATPVEAPDNGIEGWVTGEYLVTSHDARIVRVRAAEGGPIPAFFAPKLANTNPPHVADVWDSQEFASFESVAADGTGGCVTTWRLIELGLGSQPREPKRGWVCGDMLQEEP